MHHAGVEKAKALKAERGAFRDASKDKGIGPASPVPGKTSQGKAVRYDTRRARYGMRGYRILL